MIENLDQNELSARGDASAWLSAIIDHSHDAILSKTLDSTITSWNGGAERMFGYTREQAVGKPITLIIPDDRLHEEEEIISRLRAGERIDRMETVRRTRSGQAVNIEVSISPVRDSNGVIIGASKIARDIGDRMRHAEEQALLVREMHHRIKNLLSVVQALVSVGRKRTNDIDLFTDELTSRIAALAAAQQLVLKQSGSDGKATLGSIFETLLAAYGTDRIKLAPCAISVGDNAFTSLALLFHELATNAAKYGAFATPEGRLEIEVRETGRTITVQWCERGGNPPDEARTGFGSELIKASLRGLGGTMERDWDGNNLTMWLELDRGSLAL